MSRNLVICCDGTNCQFGSENTNVIRLVQCLDRTQPDKQALFYDPGLGTMSPPGALTRLSQVTTKVLGLAFGYGLAERIGEAYRQIMDVYEDGDRIFLFGFSRGAFTVRTLAGLLYRCGLPARNRHDDAQEKRSKSHLVVFKLHCPGAAGKELKHPSEDRAQ